MSIRLQLLIVALTTLILPWAGCQYARELENALRVSQERALESSADTIAHALSAEPQRVFGEADDPEPFSPAAGRSLCIPPARQPLLDGYREDWDLSAEPTALPSAAGDSLRVQAGSTARYLFLYLEVEDPHFRGGAGQRSNRGMIRSTGCNSRSKGRRVLGRRISSRPPAQGPIAAQTVVQGDDGVDRAASEPRIQAFWLQTSHGYHLEARIPLSLVGPRLWIETRDGSGAADPDSQPPTPRTGGRLFMTTRRGSTSCSAISYAPARARRSSMRTA